MPGDKRALESWAETEFGLGSGMIDPLMRVDGRDALPAHMLGWEIKSLPETFDNSLPERPIPEETPVPRLLPGEKESDRG